jgi:hypothetical protein
MLIPMRIPLVATLIVLLWAGAATTGQAASSTLSPAAVAKQVARVYGERHPHVVQLQRTSTDSPPQQPMYFMELSGHFRKGRRQARLLYFSALARRWHVWGVVAYDAQHHIVWTDALLPTIKR